MIEYNGNELRSRFPKLNESSSNEKELTPLQKDSLALTDHLVPIKTNEEQIINSIVEAETRAELENCFDMFNLNQSKKNALRVLKLSNLLNAVEDQAIDRFAKRPDLISNRELLEYMNTVSTQIDKAQKQIDSTTGIRETIKPASVTNEVNINVDLLDHTQNTSGNEELNRASKAKVMDAVASLLSQLRENQFGAAAQADPIIVDAEYTEPDEEN